VIPAYNAGATIAQVIERIPRAVWRGLRTVWIVDDGSTDGTAAVVETLAGRFEGIHPVHFPANRGYGTAVSTGLRLCLQDGCDFAVCLHADGQYPPEAIPEFVDTMAAKRISLLQGSRIASGTALSGGMPLYKYVAGRILCAVENRCFRLAMTDYHSGFLVYDRSCLQALPFHLMSRSFDFDLEAIACARCFGLTVGELPIPTRYAGEKSHLKPVSYGFRVLRVVIKYRMGYYKKLESWRVGGLKTQKNSMTGATPYGGS
jgi:glycosyltransferase involved in cell wall biosynthesis